MFMDKDILDKNSIIKKIKVKKSFDPEYAKSNIFNKRYQIWKNIYSNTKKLVKVLIYNMEYTFRWFGPKDQLH